MNFSNHPYVVFPYINYYFNSIALIPALLNNSDLASNDVTLCLTITFQTFL